MNPISTTAPVKAVLSVTDNGTPITPSSVSWISSDTDIASIDQTGVVTPKAPGSCTITGTASGTLPSGTPYTVSGSGTVTVTALGDNLVATVDFQPIP